MPSKKDIRTKTKTKIRLATVMFLVIFLMTSLAGRFIFKLPGKELFWIAFSASTAVTGLLMFLTRKSGLSFPAIKIIALVFPPFISHSHREELEGNMLEAYWDYAKNQRPRLERAKFLLQFVWELIKRIFRIRK